MRPLANRVQYPESVQPAAHSIGAELALALNGVQIWPLDGGSGKVLKIEL
mgnify:CR=1 FL=1